MVVAEGLAHCGGPSCRLALNVFAVFAALAVVGFAFALLFVCAASRSLFAFKFK